MNSKNGKDNASKYSHECPITYIDKMAVQLLRSPQTRNVRHCIFSDIIKSDLIFVEWESFNQFTNMNIVAFKEM